jgi:prolipoprotein diacylglyceryltransferase
MSDKTMPANGETKSAAARLFDIRILIGALFTLYGVMLIVAGFFTSDAQIKKASDININLWLGISMLALGLLFLLWWKVNPLKLPNPDETDDAEPSHD